MSKIDTQGMSAPADPNYKPTGKPQEHKPMMIYPRRLFTPEYVREMKILINEVLDERDGKRGKSYFDSVKFKHRINEPEPPYEKWE
tara:strand:+ start:669 stop:926 length:258 start_codon:yes stop_codon:yes gene_type:complete